MTRTNAPDADARYAGRGLKPQRKPITLADKFWDGYTRYVLTHCPLTKSGYRLDDMALELHTLANNYETHGTF